MAKSTSGKSGKAAAHGRRRSAELDPLEGANELTPAQKQALFLSGLGKIERLKADQARLTADIRNERKRLKADGFSKARVDYALECRKSSNEEIQEGLEARRDVLQMLGLGEQLSLFEGGEAVQLTPAKKAAEEGRVAGMAGKSMNECPYDKTSRQGMAWIKAWKEGQAALASGFKLSEKNRAAAEKAEAAKAEARTARRKADKPLDADIPAGPADVTAEQVPELEPEPEADEFERAAPEEAEVEHEDAEATVLQ